MDDRYQQGGGVGAMNAQCETEAASPRDDRGKHYPGIPLGGSAQVAQTAHRELMNQCAQSSLIDRAAGIIRDSVHGQDRVHRARRYLDLAAKHPEIAEMIELARNSIY